MGYMREFVYAGATILLLLGMILSVLILFHDLKVLRECRSQHNVYKCEIIAQPVEKQNDD